MRRLLPVLLVVACTHAPSTPGVRLALPTGIGTVHHPIRTRSADAQAAFDSGLVALYGFNYDEALRNFSIGFELDDHCAMCVWGFAMAVGPNINNRMQAFPGAYTAAQRAAALAEHGPPVEQAFTRALLARYEPMKMPPDPNAQDRLNKAYAASMRDAAARFPDDDDMQVLFAEALYISTPMGVPFWPAKKPPDPTAVEIRAIIERVLARSPDHIGALHFYIHVIEASPDQEAAIARAEHLLALAPRAGHLVHMASHLYMRVGRYADAERVNRLAIEADDAWLANRLPGTMYEGFTMHPWHFLWATLVIEGASAEADRVREQHMHRMHGLPFHAMDPLANDREIAFRALAAARFGRWDDALALPEPAGPESAIAVFYARGLAHVARGELDKAAESLAPLRDVRGRTLEDQPPRVKDDLQHLGEAAAAQLDGAIAAARGDVPAAVTALQHAIELEDAVDYGEPPFWLLPARQRLGAVLLAANRAAEAESVYRADLAARPETGWSLFGLARALEAQGKSAADVQTRFEKAWARADVTLKASVF